MSKYQFGDGVILQVGLESVRGTAATTFVSIPSRQPVQMQDIVDKSIKQATLANRVMNSGSRVIQKRAEGGLELDLGSESAAYFFYSLGGNYSVETVESGVYRHTITPLLTEVLHPSITFNVLQEFMTSFQFLKGMVSQAEISTSLDERVTANFSLNARSGNAIDFDEDFEFSDSDYDFVHHETYVAIVDTGESFPTSNTDELKSAQITINNNGRVDNVIGVIDANDFIGQKHEVSLQLEINKLDDDYLADYKANTPKAFRQVMIREDIELGGTHPSIAITIPYMTPEQRTEDRPRDDILKETLNYIAHVPAGSTEPLWKVEIVNAVPTYLPADES